MIAAVAAQRLANLRLSGAPARDVVSLVNEFAAVQAQDYASARWALALRARGASASAIDRALDRGDLLRTHVMRPTWQIVTPDTIGWLLALTASRVHQANASWNRAAGLDAAVLRRAQRTFRRALRGGCFLTRTELAAVLKRDGIEASGTRLAALVMAAELDAVVCSGPRRGQNFTYALFEERVPAARPWSRDGALEELARRYFSTHSPATLRDFAWWSGVTVATAREAVEMLGASAAAERLGAHTYWSTSRRAVSASRNSSIHLLPAFDEFVVGYRDRAAVPYTWPTTEHGFLGSIFAGPELVGRWRRSPKQNGAAIETTLLRKLTAGEREALQSATARFVRFG